MQFQLYLPIFLSIFISDHYPYKRLFMIFFFAYLLWNLPFLSLNNSLLQIKMNENNLNTLRVRWQGLVDIARSAYVLLNARTMYDSDEQDRVDLVHLSFAHGWLETHLQYIEPKIDDNYLIAKHKLDDMDPKLREHVVKCQQLVL